MKWYMTILAVGAVALSVGCQKQDSGAAAPAAAEQPAAAADEGLEAVESSLVAGMKYDAASQVLTVQLNDGNTYEYSGVSQAVADEFSAAESKGSYFAKNIKDQFESKKL